MLRCAASEEYAKFGPFRQTIMRFPNSARCDMYRGDDNCKDLKHPVGVYDNNRRAFTSSEQLLSEPLFSILKKIIIMAVK